MFGYVLPVKSELKVRELEYYQGAYCGLCHTLGKEYGFHTRFLLNYDFAFLSMVLAPSDEEISLQKKRCVVCPLRGKRVCRPSASSKLAADASIILTYWKLRDNVIDSSFLKGLGSRLLATFLKGAYKKAVSSQPDFDALVRECLSELRDLEQENSPSLDRTADTFARILAGIAPDDQVDSQMLYHLGRWIYLVDAWDDIPEDRVSGSYNPMLQRFDGDPYDNSEYIRTTLKHSINLALSAYQLKETGPWAGVVLNILCLGLPNVEEAVFSGLWRKKKRRANHE